MNKLLLCILVFCFGISNSVQAQTLNSKLIGDLVVENNYEAIAEYLADEVVISLNEIEESYDKEAAIEVLKTFFTENKPTKYILEHEGSAAGDETAAFGVGTLKAGDLLLETQFFIRSGKVIELCFEE